MPESRSLRLEQIHDTVMRAVDEERAKLRRSLTDIRTQATKQGALDGTRLALSIAQQLVENTRVVCRLAAERFATHCADHDEQVVKVLRRIMDEEIRTRMFGDFVELTRVPNQREPQSAQPGRAHLEQRFGNIVNGELADFANGFVHERLPQRASVNIAAAIQSPGAQVATGHHQSQSSASSAVSQAAASVPAGNAEPSSTGLPVYIGDTLGEVTDGSGRGDDVVVKGGARLFVKIAPRLRDTNARLADVVRHRGCLSLPPGRYISGGDFGQGRIGPFVICRDANEELAAFNLLTVSGETWSVTYAGGSWCQEHSGARVIMFESLAPELPRFVAEQYRKLRDQCPKSSLEMLNIPQLDEHRTAFEVEVGVAGVRGMRLLSYAGQWSPKFFDDEVILRTSCDIRDLRSVEMIGSMFAQKLRDSVAW